MKKFLVIFFAIASALCVYLYGLPDKLAYQKQDFYLQSEQDLGSIARYFYLPKSADIANWQNSIEVLYDRNQDMDLNARIALRERYYNGYAIKHFGLKTQGDTLFSYVIYPPSEEDPSWQLDAAIGKQITDCGFIQYQYSNKIKPSETLSQQEISAWLEEQANQELQKLAENHWDWSCRK